MVITLSIVAASTAAIAGFCSAKFSKGNKADPFNNIAHLSDKPSLIPPERVWAGDNTADLFSAVMGGYANTEVLWDPSTGAAYLRTLDTRGYPVSIKIKAADLWDIMSLGRGFHFDSSPVLSALETIVKLRTGYLIEFTEATDEGQSLSEEISNGPFFQIDLTLVTQRRS